MSRQGHGGEGHGLGATPSATRGDERGFRLYESGELGADGYPAAWHETLKHEVRDRAGHRCVRCLHPYAKGAGEWSPCDELCSHHDIGKLGVLRVIDAGTENETLEARWRILTVHHLDGDKANCRWWNLAALCQRCHLQIQGKVKLERVWVWEHSDWFKPYVAGYYALTYLGEDIDRDEAESRLDELLGLELVGNAQPEPDSGEGAKPNQVPHPNQGDR